MADLRESDEERLKRLLLGTELERLGRVEDRVGDDAALCASLSAVLADALREAGVRDHARLSGVLAPLMLSSLREEIRNSRDLMVDALYPITGRLVKAAVKNSFRELIETLNQRLDEGFSLRRWRTRLVARFRGLSEAEVLLQLDPPFRIQELILLHRPTGLLVARAGEPLDEVAGERVEPRVDDDLLGGMLTAIISFTKDAFGSDQEGELNTLAFGDSEIFLRMSPAVILAVRAQGTHLPGFEAALEGLFDGVLEEWGELLRDSNGNLPEERSHALEEDLRQRFRQLLEARKKRFQPPSRKGAILVAVLTAALAAWLLLSGYRTWERGQRLESAQEVLLTRPALAEWPLRVDFDRNGLLRVAGLVPDAAQRDGLRSDLALRLGAEELDYRVAVLPGGEIQSLAGRLETLASGIEEARARKADGSERMGPRIATLREALGGVEAAVGELVGRIDAMEGELVSPEERLTRWIARYAIQFEDDIAFADPRRAEAKMQRLAELILAAPGLLRLTAVGYTDVTGDSVLNRRLSTDRAAAVVRRLVELGVPRERLLYIGRSAEKMMTVEKGTRKVNRRVEFELVRPSSVTTSE